MSSPSPLEGKKTGVVGDQCGKTGDVLLQFLEARAADEVDDVRRALVPVVVPHGGVLGRVGVGPRRVEWTKGSGLNRIT